MQNTENKELYAKYLLRETFYEEMESISRKYLQYQQQIYYCPIKDIHPKMIMKIEANLPQKKNSIFGKKQDFYIINGQYQPEGEKRLERLILQIVTTIPRPKRSFGIIYVNTLADGNAYSDFQNVLELLPVQFQFNLTKIYVLQPSFLSKAARWLSFGVIKRYIQDKTIHVDNLNQLSRQSHIDLQFLNKNLPENIIAELKRQIQAENEKRALASNGFSLDWTSMVGFNSNKIIIPEQELIESISRSKSEGQSLSQSKSTQKYIQQYQIGPSGAPRILQLLIYYFASRQESLKLEGIFRKSVSIDDQNQIMKELKNKNYSFIQNVSNPHIIANTIKRFLYHLRTPIIPYKVFQIFMEKDSEPQYQKIVVQNIKNLPNINKMALFLLFDFLRNTVLKYAVQNKMGEQNICIVFGPCLMRSEIPSFQDLIYAKKIIMVTGIIFKNFELIFGNSIEQDQLRRTSFREYNKQIMRGESSQQKIIPKQHEKLLQPLTFNDNLNRPQSLTIEQGNDQLQQLKQQVIVLDKSDYFKQICIENKEESPHISNIQDQTHSKTSKSTAKYFNES